jgi:hypothetical protein
MKREVTREMAKEAMKKGWTYEEATKGYAVASSEDIMGGALHIQRIDELNAFDSDDEAAEYAEKSNGVKVIHDLPDYISENDRANFIDTPDNREKIEKYILDTYNSRWVRKVTIVNRGKLVYEFQNRKDKFTHGQYETFKSCIGAIIKLREKSIDSIFCTMGITEYTLNNKELVRIIRDIKETKELDSKLEDDIIFEI